MGYVSFREGNHNYPVISHDSMVPNTVAPHLGSENTPHPWRPANRSPNITPGS